MGTHLEQKLRQLGMTADGGQSAVRIGQISRAHSFQLRFPFVRVSDGYHFTAAPDYGRDAYNFTGKVLGVKGQNAADIAGSTGARVEVCDMEGNLKGRRPDPLDPNLHVLITSDSMLKIQKAVKTLCEQLAPKGCGFKPFNCVSGGSTKLELSGPPPQQRSTAEAPSNANNPHKAISKVQWAQPFGNQQQNAVASETPTGAALKSQQRRSTKVFTGARATPNAEAASLSKPVEAVAAQQALSPWQQMAAATKSEVDARIKANATISPKHLWQAEERHSHGDIMHWEPTTPHKSQHFTNHGSGSSSDGSVSSERAVFANLEGFGAAAPQQQAAPAQREQTQGLQARLAAAAAAAPHMIEPSDAVDVWPVSDAAGAYAEDQQELWPTMLNIPIPIPVPVPSAAAAPAPDVTAVQQGSMEVQESADLSELLALLDVQQ